MCFSYINTVNVVCFATKYVGKSFILLRFACNVLPCEKSAVASLSRCFLFLRIHGNGFLSVFCKGKPIRRRCKHYGIAVHTCLWALFVLCRTILRCGIYGENRCWFADPYEGFPATTSSPKRVAEVLLTMRTRTVSPMWCVPLSKTTILFCSVRPHNCSRLRLL